MLYDILQDEEFSAILSNHALEILHYLLEKEEEFAIIADKSAITFDPMLPQEIYDALAEFPLFLLVNYSFESARLEGRNLVFEAGFGAQNFGSTLSVPIDAILQIIVDETPIFVNLTATIKKKPSYKNSMEALLSNPENQKFLKKR